MMNKFSKFIFIFLLLGCGFLFARTASAAGCSSTGACYWVGGSGNTNDTTHWATASGGATTGGLPTSADDCIFDSGSSGASYTTTVNAPLNCKDLTFSNPASGSPTLAGSSQIYIVGSITYVSGMIISYTGSLAQTISSGTKTITSNNVSGSYSYTKAGAGEVQLIDNLGVKKFTQSSGTFDATTNSTTVTLRAVSGSTSYVGGLATFYNLTLINDAIKTGEFNTGNGFIVTNNLVINGDSAVNRLLVNSSVIGTQQQIQAKNLSVSNADFKNISQIHSTRKIVTIGDSLTGSGSYPSTLQTSVRIYSGNEWSVVNAGTSGNTTTQMLDRFTSDVINVTGTEYVIILGGINDIQGGATAELIEGNLQTMYTNAHNAGLKVVAIKLTPFKGFNWTQEKQNTQDAINTWIVSSAINVDYVVDAYSALVDPSNPNTLLSAYDSGDHLHPSSAGYSQLATTIYSGVTWVPISNAFNISAGTNGDCGGNSRITFTSLQTNYWYKASGNDNWSTTDNWYLGSGGTGGVGRVPLCQDTAVFDTASFGVTGMTLTQNMPRVGTVTFGSLANSPTFTTNVATSVFGSLTLAPVANWTFTASTQAYTFEGRSSHVLTTNGNTWAKSLALNAPSGTLSLADTPTMGASNTFTITNGTLSSNYKVMTIVPTTAFTLGGGILNLYNNVFYRSSVAGTLISESSGTLNLKNNIFYNISDILSSSGGTNSISNNIYYNSSDEGGSGSLTSDPEFVSPGSNFSLQSTSPAINAGTNVSLTSDILSVSVPQGGGYDIGAYEYTQSTAPTVSISAPSPGTISGSVSVTATAGATSPATVSSVQFKLDGVNLESADTESPYSTTWDTTTASNGSHELTAVVTDSYSNSATSDIVTVIVDNVGPIRSVGSPSGSQTAGTTQVTLSLTTDESATCKYSTTAETAYGSMAGEFTTAGGTNHAAVISGLSNGQSYNYYVRCTDGANININDYTISFSIASPSGGGGGSPAIWTLPTIPSNGFKLTINNGALTTSNRNVVLGFNAGTDIKKVAISMTGDFTDANQEDYVAFKQWDLCSKLGGLVKNPTCPDRKYTIYARFYTVYGRTTGNAFASSTIILKSGSTPTENLHQINNLPFTNPFTKYLQYRQTNADIKRLQIFLNSDPTTQVAKSGAGSPGKETNFFGLLTKKAVIKFQEKYAKDILLPWGFKKGTGYVGKTTLLKINELIKSK